MSVPVASSLALWLDRTRRDFSYICVRSRRGNKAFPIPNKARSTARCSIDPIPMEMEAPAHHGTVVAAADNDGAYGIAEMPKRFVLGNQQQHDKYSGRMAAFHAMDVRITALNESARRSAANLIRKLRSPGRRPRRRWPPSRGGQLALLAISHLVIIRVYLILLDIVCLITHM